MKYKKGSWFPYYNNILIQIKPPEQHGYIYDIFIDDLKNINMKSLRLRVLLL